MEDKSATYWKANKLFLTEDLQKIVLQTATDRLKIHPCRNGRDLSAAVMLTDQREILLHSIYDPIQEAELFVRKSSPKERAILFGCGLGYPVQAFLDQLPPNGELILIIINNDIFSAACHKKDLTRMLQDTRLKIIASASCRLLIEQLQQIFNSQRDQSTRIAIWPTEVKAIQNDFLAIKEVIELFSIRQRSYQAYRETTIYNLQQNLPAIISSPGISDFRHTLNKLPAVVVSAGPSLKSVLPILFLNQHKLIIIAVATALKALVTSGIKPDLIVITDAKRETYHQLEGIETDSPLLFLPAACAEAIRLYSAPKIIAFPLYDCLFTQIEHILHKGLLDSGSSVATIACSAAAVLGCSPIILVGQDLSLSDNGETYAPGCSEQQQTNTGLRKIKGINGNTKLTLDNFYSFIKWFADFAKNHPETILINCSADGAAIENIPAADFAETIGSLKTELIKKPVFTKPSLDQITYPQETIDSLNSLLCRFQI